MTIEDLKQKIESLAKKAVEGTGVDLIECKVAGHSNDAVIQITADKLPGGITIRECVILNKALVAAIKQENLLTPGTFSLEVSSPGIDRPS
jgi:ribosome maturation factor RimP